MTKLRIHLSIAISIQKQPPGQPAQNLRELGGIGTAEKHWSTVTINGYDKKANLRLDEVKFSSSESINSICNIEAVVRMGDGSLGNSRGTGAAEKRWNTAAFNGYDKKANLRLAEVKFSSSESINLHPQYGSGSPERRRGIWGERHGAVEKTLEYRHVQRS